MIMHLKILNTVEYRLSELMWTKPNSDNRNTRLKRKL